jgi:hypothetical protein
MARTGDKGDCVSKRGAKVDNFIVLILKVKMKNYEHLLLDEKSEQNRIHSAGLRSQLQDLRERTR